LPIFLRLNFSRDQQSLGEEILSSYKAKEMSDDAAFIYLGRCVLFRLFPLYDYAHPGRWLLWLPCLQRGQEVVWVYMCWGSGPRIPPQTPPAPGLCLGKKIASQR